MIVLIFLLSTFLAYVYSLAVRSVAIRTRVIDQPDTSRKLHSFPMPLMGGLAVFLALVSVVVLTMLFASPNSPQSITDSQVTLQHLLGLLFGSFIIVVGGVCDDRFSLKPHQQLLSPLCAIAVVIASGIGVREISNPFGSGSIDLTSWNILLFWWNGVPHYFTVWADTLTFLWLLGMMYTTKLLDGLDGLVSGLTIIGAGIIGVVSMYVFINEPTLILSVITAGIFAGFFILNFPPARLYLGEGGSLLAGYLLGILSILSGAKLATALLVVGIPVLDAARVISVRLRSGQSPFLGDRRHLHFRLQTLGFSPRQALILYLTLALGFGCSALFLQRFEKIVALVILVVFAISFYIFIHRSETVRSR